MNNNIVILDTGCGNFASLKSAFAREGFSCEVSCEAETIANAERLVLPGVGSFGAAMHIIRTQGLDKLIVNHVKNDKPLLAVCLGLQLLCKDSEESPGIAGLGMIDASVKRLKGQVRIPQMGFNRVGDAWYYFAHSYCIDVPPLGFDVQWCNYGESFPAQIAKGSLLACQFHPELSGEMGRLLLRSWLKKVQAIRGETNCRRVIACLDVKNGRVVKGIQFQSLRDAGDPVECASRYESEGVDEICVLDIAATLEERGTTISLVGQLRPVLSIPLIVGGGIRTLADARALLEAGADKIAINSAAIEDPSIIGHLARQFGSQCVVVAIDAAGSQVYSRAGTTPKGLDAITWAKKTEELGAGEILFTSIDRDGTKSGYDLQILRDLCGSIQIPVIASGGAHSPDDLVLGFQAGASACLAASMFHDRLFNMQATKRRLQQQGIKVRL